MNFTTLTQLVSLFFIVALGPACILYFSLKKAL